MKSLFIAILFSIFYVAYLLFTQLLFGDNNLTEIKGQLHKKHSYVKADTLLNNKIINCAYLSFLMREDKRLYELKVDIDGIHQGFNVFGGVDRKLELAGQISVWIKKSDLMNASPKIYKILADEVQIYENLNKPGDNGLLILSISCLIAFFIAVYFCMKHHVYISSFIKTVEFKIVITK